MGQTAAMTLSIDHSTIIPPLATSPLTTHPSPQVLVYPIGLPVVLYFMLWRHRKLLNPPACSTGVVTEVEVITKLKQNPLDDKAPICYFAKLYRPRYWWYEPVNMSRRLALTCGSALFNLGETTILILVIAIVTLVAESG